MKLNVLNTFMYARNSLSHVRSQLWHNSFMLVINLHALNHFHALSSNVLHVPGDRRAAIKPTMNIWQRHSSLALCSLKATTIRYK